MKVGDLIAIRGAYKWIGIGVITRLYTGYNNEYHQIYIDDRKLFVDPKTLEVINEGR
tara:strand:- start:159 stop:329 length:171 start_codon:yes stop_codon:yes gene_type:complete